MGRHKKIISIIEETTYEYVNCSDRSDRPELMFFPMSDGTTKKVFPGKSIFFTQRDIDNHLAMEDKRFKEGRIRPKDAKDFLGSRTGDEMSEMEIEMFVRDTTDQTVFLDKVSQINASPTMHLFLDFVKKYDRSFSFFDACTKRLQELNAERERAMNPQPLAINEKAAQVTKRLNKKS